MRTGFRRARLALLVGSVAPAGLDAATLPVDTTAPSPSPVEKAAREWEARFSNEGYIPASSLEKSVQAYFKQLLKACGMAAGGDLADISRIIGRARAQMAGDTERLIQEFVNAGYKRADVEVYFDRLYARLQRDLLVYFGRNRETIRKPTATEDTRTSDELWVKSRLSYQEKDYVGALKALDDALRFAPANARFYLEAGLRQQASGQLAEARANFDEARERCPKVVNIYIASGSIRAAAKDYLGAIDDFTTAIYLDPGALPAYSLRGSVRQELDDYEGAIDDYSLQIASGFPTGLGTVYVRRGWAHYTLGNTEIAREDFAAAVRAEPNVAAGHRFLGMTLGRLGDPQAGLLALDKAVELQPKSLDVYGMRMWIHLRLGDEEAALRDADLMLELGRDRPYVHKARAVLLDVMDHNDSAEREYREAIALAKKNGDMGNWSYANFQMDMFLRRQGRMETSYLDGVLDWPDDWSKRVGLFLSGRISAESLVTAARQAPNRQERLNQECEANFYVGMTLWTEGNRAAAEPYLNTAALAKYDGNLECTLARKLVAKAPAKVIRGSSPKPD